ncbi:DUF116 domain-containing protein [Methanosarcina sp. KYL-1]|uniref:DUF116 domain-containing protein n=1 Tax=Methanosarcina sp. KYL-1 TaxID=2602068 RepID=UPI0021013956|nr:DUF116 domain-containing protein [Methanosarcina sp. KYL-1]MCQ1536033.1 DUF116 domain-containing protein [Methanosarcina sp. KYL-1]
MQIPYEFLGKVFIYMLLFALAGTGLALIIGAYSFKKHRIIFPSFVLFTLYLFYSPAKLLCRAFRIRDTLVDDILIDVRNAVMLEDFVHVKDRRVVFLPQCLRHPNCKARCDPVHGYECKRCGLCDIAKVCEAGDMYNFKIFVIPGGSFVKKIFKEYGPKACLGVACYNELSESMQEVSFIPVQGVLLLKDGCFNTEANIEEIIQKMELCDV